MFTNYHVLRIYQNTIRMFFMLVLCQSGMGVILIITALVVLCFGFVSKAGLTMFGLLSSACTASRLSLFPTLCPSVSGRKGSGQGCGCLAVGPGHPTRVQSLRETESQLHCVLGVAACAKDDHPVWYWKVQTCGKFVPQLLHTGLSGLFSQDLPSCRSWRGCEIYFLLSSEAYLWLPHPFRSGKEFAMTADSCPSTTECTPSSLSCWIKWSLALLVALYHD